MSELYFGQGKNKAVIQLNRLNRHGIIAGATGTGKTVTLKVLAEQMSDAGIPVFLADIKGDLISLAEANSNDVSARIEKTKRENYSPKAYPVQLWDVLGQKGTPIRMTISEMGPVLLTRLLGLNETQESILNIVFRIADERKMLLIDLMDLRAMLNYVAENASELREYFGNIPVNSVGAILRSLVVIEQQGGKFFFGEPSLDIQDFMRVDTNGHGVINILNATQLFNQPTLYSTVLLTILSELYEVLPEVGDLPQPKLVFFFDEAHVLFKDTPKVLLEKIELIVRLIRSKGVGVFFVTQNPTDIPDAVASQLGNRIQHGLRAFTPKELKTVSTVADTFRQEAGEDLAKVIQELQVGEAVVSTLQADGTPSIADRVLIYPPQSHMGTVEPNVALRLLNNSELMEKYAEAIDRESAHEQILAMTKEKEAQLIHASQEAEYQKAEQIRQREIEKSQPRESYSRSHQSDTVMDRFTKNVMSQVGRELGKVVTRGIMGMFKK